jgi:hypothetical protein
MHIQAVIEPLGVCIRGEEIESHPGTKRAEKDMRRKKVQEGGGGEQEKRRDPLAIISRVPIGLSSTHCGD